MGILAYVILKVATRRFKEVSIVSWVLFAIFVAHVIMKTFSLNIFGD